MYIFNILTQVEYNIHNIICKNRANFKKITKKIYITVKYMLKKVPKNIDKGV